MMKNYFITGITGQDGLFLTKKIFEENEYATIYGSTRKSNPSDFYNNLSSICNFDDSKIKLVKLDLLDNNELFNFLKEIKPIQVYNLSGPRSVYESYRYPSKTKYEILTIFDNLINNFIKLESFPKFFQASSSEMYGKQSKENLTEEDSFDPISPYAKAKLENHKKVSYLRYEYDWEIYSGILFNHESQFRSDDYLIKKIINKAKDISKKNEKIITLGSLEYQRDWTYAEDTVDAMYKILNSESKQDYVIGSGELHTIHELADSIFKFFKLDLQKHLHIDPNILRKNDPVIVGSSPEKLIKKVGWKKMISFEEMLKKTIEPFI